MEGVDGEGEGDAGEAKGADDGEDARRREWKVSGKVSEKDGKRGEHIEKCVKKEVKITKNTHIKTQIAHIKYTNTHNTQAQ